MALTYSPVEIKGSAAEPVLGELFFLNKTVADGDVNFETDIKASTIFTENENTVSIQPFISGAPTADGSLGLTDVEITPKKQMVYVEFAPETLRPSRFNKSMAAGAWNLASTEFEKVVLSMYASKISSETEKLFWNGIISGATRTSIAALTGATTQAKSWAATKSAPAQFDGVVAKLVLDQKATFISGTTITSSNIATEYAKAYAAMNPVLIDAFEAPYIYAPKGHKQLINIYNSNATYRDLFSKDGEKMFYNGIEIRFKPLADNTLVITLPSFISWCTDLTGDVNQVKIEKIANNREDMFIKAVFTLDSYVGNQKYAVVYNG